jgi:diguanylate cyclase (GGDEF)-like protein
MGAGQVRKFSRRYVPMWVIIFLGISLSILSFYVLRDIEDKNIESSFSLESKNLINAINRELLDNLEVLQGLHSFYLGSQEVTRAEFSEATRRPLQQRQTIQALEWIPRVTYSEREIYEESARTDGYPVFQFTEREAQGVMVRAKKRDEYLPVYFVEPYKGNEIALGFDLSSNPARLRALNKARDSGEMIATERITLVQETEEHYGFLVVIPIYQKQKPVRNVVERRANLEGFILGVFRVEKIIASAYGYLQPKDIGIRLFDNSNSQDKGILYSRFSYLKRGEVLTGNKENIKNRIKLEYSEKIRVADREWLIVSNPLPQYVAFKKIGYSWLISVGILLVFCLVVIFLNRNIKHTIYTERLLEKLSSEVAERKRMEEKLRALSLTDELTGLYNRRGFFMLAEQQLKLASREKRGMMIFSADFDYLKTINDTLGHQIGDIALIETANILKETFRDSDIIARIGGDEFVILAMQSPELNTETITTRMNEKFDVLNAQADRTYKLSLSFGLTNYDPGHPCSI